MNILILRGNPRKNGHTQRITDLFVEGARKGGASIDQLDLPSSNINRCSGCYTCWTITPGKCIFDDDMPSILERMYAADILVCATPLYYYSMSSAMKTFFERTLPVTRHGFEITERRLVRNKVRFPQQWDHKKLVTIITGAFKKMDNFNPLKKTFELIADGMSMHLAGQLIRPESYLLQFALAKPKTVKTVENAFIQAGNEIARNGSISEPTIQNVSIPLAIDMFHFQKYSNIFWEHAFELGKDAADMAKLQEHVTGDVRILMHEMARSIDSVATSKLKAVLQFDFPDKDLHFAISVNRGSCTLEETEKENPDLQVICPTDVWARAFMRQISMKDALLNRSIQLKGDKSLFSRLERFFPPPVS
ncbi:MAG: hypothetical protein GF350_01930 [Chitinivibrionales bacterium]|nr:hypothetical protein [Chitinivibrionales bacterium]